MDDEIPDVDMLDEATINSMLEMGLTLKSTVVDQEMVETICNSLDHSGDEASQRLWEDLTSPMLSPDQGPLSFRRLSGIDVGTLQSLGSMTFLQALESPQVDPEADRETLECLAEYGELLAAPVFPESTRFTGAVLHVMALSALSERCGVVVEMSDVPSTIKLLQTIETSPRLSDELREHASRSTQFFQPSRDP